MARGAAAAGGTLMCCLDGRDGDTGRRSPRPRRARRAGFQIYVFRDRGVTDEVIAQALEAGFSALVLTADLPVFGSRDRERRIDGDPEDDVPAFVRARANGLDDDWARPGRSGLDWDYVEHLVTALGVPVVVKGLVTAEDAMLACEHGAAGVVVSNHGGRQLDARAGDPRCAARGRGRCRRTPRGAGRRRRPPRVAMSLIALALGARAVLVGRPGAVGSRAGGEQGAAEVLELLRDETENALALLGCRPAEDRGRVAPT